MDAPKEFPMGEPPVPSPESTPVKTVKVHRTLRRKGFTYHEQRITDTASTPIWDEMFSKRVSTFGGEMLGYVENGTLRWSDEAPNHFQLMHPAAGALVGETPKSIPYVDIVRKKTQVPEIQIYGDTVPAQALLNVAHYLRRNIHGHDDVQMTVAIWSSDSRESLYEGLLGDFPAES